MRPDNTEESFKCSKCGLSFARGQRQEMKCPSCGFNCSLQTCPSLGASNEEY